MTVKPNTMLQQHIMTEHAIDNLPLLQRNNGGSFGHGQDIYSLHSISIHPRYDGSAYHVTPRFMPNFEFDIQSMCSFKIPGSMFAYSPNTSSSLTGPIVTQEFLESCDAGIIMNDEGIIARLRGSDGSAVPVHFKKLPDLFHARNAALEGRLASLLHPTGKLETPISEDMGRVTLGFTALADKYGFLEGRIAIDHPSVETFIHRLFETIERRSDDYMLLDEHHSEGDLYEFQQSSQYRRQCKKLHKTMFRDIEDVCKEHAENGKLVYWHDKPNLMLSIVQKVPLLAYAAYNWQMSRYKDWREKEI